MTAVRITKRRAFAARLLACAVPAFLFLAGVASAARPDTPALVTTSPTSFAAAPATSLTPSVLGEAEPGDIVVIESVPFRWESFVGPIASDVKNRTENPEFEIEIFEGSECHGPAVATGTAEALEGSGIQVTVTADSATTFTAIQVDPHNLAEPSLCSTPLMYWEGNVLPVGGDGEEAPGGGSEVGGKSEAGADTEGDASVPASAASSGDAIGNGAPAGGKPDAPRIHVDPAARANVLTPVVLGSAPGAGGVALYANGDCSGSPVAKGTPVELSAGFTISVTPNVETTFSAVATGSQRSSCSAPVTYTEDSIAPRTRVTMGPGVKTRKHDAVLRFKDVTTDPPGTTFVCRVDKARWRHCASPFRAKHLKVGPHVVRIRATDLAGNVERHPIKRRFRVVPRP